MNAPTNLHEVPSGTRRSSIRPALVPTKPELILILRDTLDAVDREPELDPRDPKVIEIKRSIRQSLSELESEGRRAA